VAAVPRVPVIAEALAAQIRAIIDAEPVVGLRMITAPHAPEVRGAREP
jgi:hypothetical protein